MERSDPRENILFKKLQLNIASWRLSNQDADPGGGHGDSPWHSTDPNLIIATIWETIGFE